MAHGYSGFMRAFLARLRSPKRRRAKKERDFILVKLE
jgi:hypothetical protein